MIETQGKTSDLQPDVMKWIWIGAFIVVALFGYGLTKWEVIQQLIENKGVGEEGSSMIAFAAGYTFPLTVAFGVITLIFLRGRFSNMHPFAAIFLVAAILVTSEAIAADLGLGLLPAYEGGPPIEGPGGGQLPARILAWALDGYFNTYGWPLMVSSLAIGFASGAQVHVWIQTHEN